MSDHLIAEPGSVPPEPPPWAPAHPATELASRLVSQLGAVVLGNPEALRLTVAAFLAGGHVLLEDVPGVGKTVLAKTVARSIGGTAGRVQGTPDLLPSDLTGVSIYHEESGEWRFQRGPLFNNVVIVDELNRATPRTQAALLEAMAEWQVSVDGVTHPLPDPFLVIATQNPVGDTGTFPLVPGQRDRFSVALSLGLPGRDGERALLRRQGGEELLGRLEPLAPVSAWAEIRASLEDDVHLHEFVIDYTLDLVDALRRRVGGEQPVSPRASIALAKVARAHAVVDGRTYVAPDDVQRVAGAVLAHRVVDVAQGHLPTARHLVEEVVRSTPVPPRPPDLR